MRNFTYFIIFYVFIIFSACDDGNDDNNTANNATTAVCGNGIVETGEQCDGDNLFNKTCKTEGYYDGVLSCSSNCTFDVSLCEDFGKCGNGIAEADEQCDGTDLRDKTCESEGYYDGILRCNNDCKLDLSQCETFGRCGDGIIQTQYGEECEGSNLNGQSCETLFNQGRGTLFCTTGCKFDTSQCEWCGDGIVNGDEVCDGTEFVEDTCAALGYWWGSTSGVCNSDCIPTVISGCYNVKQLGTAYEDYAEAVAVDSAGNVYIAGYTYGDFFGTEYTGSSDIFLAKYDSSGNELWIKQFGTAYEDYVSAAAVDSAGNVYITGRTFGDFSGTGHTNYSNIFLAKYDSSGNELWTKLWGSGSGELVYDMAIYSDQVYIVGSTYGGFDSYTNSGQRDIFLTGLDSSGNILFIRQWGSAYDDLGRGVTVDPSGNIYVLGNTNGSWPDHLRTGSYDVILIKMDPSGTELWKKFKSGDANSFPSAILSDDIGNIYISGCTLSSEFDGNVNKGMADAFLMKYNANGGRLWTRLFGTEEDESLKGLTADDKGNLYMVIYTAGNLDGLPNLGVRDVFWVSFDEDGNMLKTDVLGSDANEAGFDIAFGPGGHGYVAGFTSGSLESKMNSGERDAFIWRINP